jgi:hypothetical protein
VKSGDEEVENESVRGSKVALPYPKGLNLFWPTFPKSRFPHAVPFFMGFSGKN